MLTVIPTYLLGMLLLHIGYQFIAPPKSLPDLFPALFALYDFVNLSVAYLYCITWQLVSIKDLNYSESAFLKEKAL